MELRGGQGGQEGNLYINNLPVCELNHRQEVTWRLREAGVVCRMLGFQRAVHAFTGCRSG